MANPTYFALIEACHQPGCPVCRLAQQAVEQMLNGLFYESVNDIEIRSRLRKSLGFCNQHTWQLLEKGGGDMLGIATIYHDIFTNVLRRLPQDMDNSASKEQIPSLLRQISRKVSSSVASIKYALTPHEPCLACQHRNETAAMVLKVLWESLSDPDLKNAYQHSSGLCLPHLRQAFEQNPLNETSQLLLTISREKLQSLDKELAEIIRKSDYRLIEQGFGSEGDAWKRALQTAAGENEMGFWVYTKDKKNNG